MDWKRLLKNQLLILGEELGAEVDAGMKKDAIVSAIEGLNLSSEDIKETWNEIQKQQEQEREKKREEQERQERREQQERQEKREQQECQLKQKELEIEQLRLEVEMRKMAGVQGVEGGWLDPRPAAPIVFPRDSKGSTAEEAISWSLTATAYCGTQALLSHPLRSLIRTIA
ncbi:hypothetical protein MTO96_008337 [Rhipicephalus appendiculatus]